MLTALLDNFIRIEDAEIDKEVVDDLLGSLEIENEAKKTAKREQHYGWTEMPDTIPLYSFNEEQLLIPRGFKTALVDGLNHYGYDISFVDRRTDDPVMRFLPSFGLRPQQGPAADSVLRIEDGIVESPAGSGKTVNGLEIVRRARQRHNLIVVNQIDIATQWQKEAAWALPDLRTGIIGEGRWEEAPLTFATNQTLYARRYELDDLDWWRKWGLVCLDECHHQQADTFMEVMQRFCSRYRFGLSATPDKTGSFAMATAVLGVVIHRTTRHELREHGILARPQVDVVDTGFEFAYWPTHTAHKFEDCQKPGCNLSRKKRHFHRNNYSKLLKALTNDTERNSLIASRALVEANEGKRVLIDSAHKGHLERIQDEIMLANDYGIPVYWMTGEEYDEQRHRIRAAIDRGPGIILSTIAREAVNMPRLDSVHLAFPIRNPGAIRQLVGRVERAVEGKDEPTIHDYRDAWVGVLVRQYQVRRWEVYAVELYKVNREEEDEQQHDAGPQPQGLVTA